MYGNLIDVNHILMDGVSLGDGSSTPKTTESAELYVGNNPGLFRVEVRAKTALTVVTAKALNVELECGASGACAAPVSGTHQYIAHKTSADDEKVYAAGALIGYMVLAKEHGPYIKVKTYTDEDHITETVDIFLTPVG